MFPKNILPYSYGTEKKQGYLGRLTDLKAFQGLILFFHAHEIKQFVKLFSSHLKHFFINLRRKK